MEEKSNLKNPAFCCFETPWRILAFALKCPCPVKHVVQKATYSAMTIPEQSKTWKAALAQQLLTQWDRCPRGLE